MSIEIDKLLIEREKLETRLRQINKFIAAYESVFGTKVDRNDTRGSKTEIPTQSYSQPDLDLNLKRKVVPAEIAALSAKLIRDLGEPMKRGELVEAIENMGYEIRSKDKNRYVGTILWRNIDKFDNIEGYGYWLRELGPPPSIPSWVDTFSEYKKILDMD